MNALAFDSARRRLAPPHPPPGGRGDGRRVAGAGTGRRHQAAPKRHSVLSGCAVTQAPTVSLSLLSVQAILQAKNGVPGYPQLGTLFFIVSFDLALIEQETTCCASFASLPQF